MFKIKTLDKIDENGLRLLNDDYTIVNDDNADAILLRSYKMHDMELPESLKAVGRAGAGVNNIPLEKCAEKGIVVFNTPGANANGVKELVLAGLFIASRDVAGAIDWGKSLKEQGDKVPKLVEEGKSNFAGPEILGKTLGVIGLGAIGVLVANAACSLGMEVLGYDPFISVDSAWGLSSLVQKATSLEDLYSKCDYITVHVPLMKETEGMIGTASIKNMKDGVRILNFSRAELVNDDEIKLELESGKVAKYVTDFPNSKTFNMPNTICIPHLGASTPESEINCAIMAVNQIREYLENGNIINSVNYPECNIGGCSTVGRVAINHRNIPNMVSQITSIVAGENVNIGDMINKSKKEWAYTVLDVEDAITDKIVKALEAINGVVKVRVIK
ncbi:MAG: 3-phosphoglycerate dehydrogenase [Firmicutes bacterium HGW-Firmicutes-1]|jgi:D-3-phosphoglycerate dehydrogenase|nr:MAG: 3-phosphoglycerate dehydrogenase [Firmicutes bacterium HGW-Firmicutes-1]